MQTSRATLLRWSILFFIGNIPLFWFIAIGCVYPISWLQHIGLNFHEQLFVNTFTISAYLGQLGLLSLLPFLILTPFILLFPKRNFIIPLAIIISTFATILLVIDISTYTSYRFHLNSTILDLAVNGLHNQVWQISSVESLGLLGRLAGLLIIEIILAIVLWKFLDKKILNHVLKWLVILFCIGSLYLSYTLIFLSYGKNLNHVLVNIARALPFYKEFFTVLIPINSNRTVINQFSNQFVIQPNNNSVLAYPLHQIKCETQTKPLNLILIVIDTWRHDMLNSDVSPTLADFSKHAWVFNQHFSGGNATAPGLFSLFYGLPASYWSVMKAQHKGPIFIDELIKQHYQMGIFSSATLKIPAFDKTLFCAINPLRSESKGQTPAERDEEITQDFKKFIATASQKKEPFFSFLFYDSAHGYCGFVNSVKRFNPVVENCNHMNLTNDSDPLPYLNRYKNAVYLIDQKIKQVLDTLKNYHLLENTIVVITGDHGEEFNDNHQGFWGHASNFTHYQVQTPLIVYWPGQTPKVISYTTSHFDIVPTLMKRLLSCKMSSPFNYSLGEDLLNSKSRPYIIVGSYTDYGIIEPDRIDQITPSGNYYIENKNAEPNPKAELNISLINNVFRDLHRFY